MQTRLDDPKEEDTYAHRCADRAIRFLEEFREKDFFLTLSLDEPHDPSVCPRRFVEALKKQKLKFHRTPNVKYKLKTSLTIRQSGRRRAASSPSGACKRRYSGGCWPATFLRL